MEATDIWAETRLLVTHKSNFCGVVKAKVRPQKIEEWVDRKGDIDMKSRQ